MFGKLKDKLKKTISVFSKKTEEEAEKKEVEETKEEDKVEEAPKEEVKEEIKEELIEEKVPEEQPEKEIEKKEEIQPTPPQPPAEKEAEEVVEKEPEVKEKKGFFKKFKQTITTKTISEEKFNKLFQDLELALLENNVSVEVIEKIKQDLKEELVNKPLPRDVPKKIEETLKQTLTEILTLEPINIIHKIKQKLPNKSKEGLGESKLSKKGLEDSKSPQRSPQREKKPYVIAFFGINGSGKTTTLAKISHLLQKNGLKTVLAASDTFRAAAIQQLEEHANKLDTKIIKHDYGSDAAAVAFDAIKYAQKNNIDAVLIDTAGRLHSNVNLMGELKKIVRVTNPDLKIFIGESITGNDCIEQAKQFNDIVNIDAAILTKADVDEKGGAPLSISYTIKKPILYLGTGQNYEDLEEFNTKTILDRLGF